MEELLKFLPKVEKNAGELEDALEAAVKYQKSADRDKDPEKFFKAMEKLDADIDKAREKMVKDCGKLSDAKWKFAMEKCDSLEKMRNKMRELIKF